MDLSKNSTNEWEVLARLALLAVGSICLGQYGYIGYWLSVPLVLMWCWYSLTYPLARVAVLSGVGLVALLINTRDIIGL